MEPQQACLKVLDDAAPEALHWTVVLDRALEDRGDLRVGIFRLRRAGGRRPGEPAARLRAAGVRRAAAQLRDLLARRAPSLLERLAHLVTLLRRGEPAEQHAQPRHTAGAVQPAARALAPSLAELLGLLGEQLHLGAPRRTSHG